MWASELPQPGSSPLARGLLRPPHPVLTRLRIIPARAGFTLISALGNAKRTDHPRSRGVYTKKVPTFPSTSGSSPLARGLLEGGCPRGHVDGIIPARAGFTWGELTHSGTSADHPRSRGVYGPRLPVAHRQSGSSPLARGLLDRHPLLRVQPGIIPARAGFTDISYPPSRRGRDHPRSRGVYPRRC